MNQGIFTIAENLQLTHDTYRMKLAGDAGGVTAPGQFINISLPGHFLRRPISVCDADEGSITIIYKVLGRGTLEMTELLPGVQLDVLTGLGNGYDISAAGEAPLLIGGGVGIPPLYLLAKKLIAAGARPHAVLGYNSAADIFYADEFAALGCGLTIATADGSRGAKGFVTDALPADYSYFYTCGPSAMLRAVERAAKEGCGGQFSFEERMGCGFGACMGCSMMTKGGAKRVCKDGPVFRREKIIWED